MPRLSRLVRRLLHARPTRPLLPRPRGEYDHDGFPIEHPRSVRPRERDR